MAMILGIIHNLLLKLKCWLFKILIKEQLQGKKSRKLRIEGRRLSLHMVTLDSILAFLAA